MLSRTRLMPDLERPHLDPRHRKLRDAVRRFAEAELAPLTYDLDQRSEFPIEIFRQLGEMGYLGAPIDQKYGGSGGSLTDTAVILEQLAAVSAAVAMSYMVHVVMVSYASIQRLGTEEQKLRYLPRLCKGEMIGALGVTEPDAGSDVYGVRTRGETRDGSYVLNGSKIFISNVGAAMPAVVHLLAVTSNEGGRKRMTGFLVEKGTPGFSLGKEFDKCGMRASCSSEIFLKDVVVPAESILGEPERGLRQCMAVLDHERALAGSLNAGMMDAALTRSLAYSKERVQFGQPIANFQAIHAKLAIMATDLQLTHSMIARVLDLVERQENFTAEAAMLKWWSGERAKNAAIEAVQIHGGYGYMRESGIERLVRDSLLSGIGGGTTEVLYSLIARLLLEGD